MSKLKMNVTLHASAASYKDGGVAYHVFEHPDMSSCGYVACDTVEVEFDVPPKDVLVPGFIKAYRAEQSRIRAEAEAKAMDIEETIQKLLAIEDKS